MDWLFEGLWTILIVGVVIEIILGLILLNTGRAVVLVAMIGVAALVGVAAIVERIVVTDREAVTGALQGAADALEANDIDALFAYVGPEAQALRSRALQELPRFRIKEAKVGGLKVTVNRVHNPPTARTELIGTFKVQDKKQQVPYENYVQRFAIRWRQEGDRWLMVDYEEGTRGE
ncbi:MAG: hypothetical protein KF708_16100 [Pirellulales bacterium]|nr:hypothetical protein [Pirellulales bacterium]